VSDRSTTYLRDRASGQLVAATLIDGVSLAEVEAAESVWRPAILDGLAARAQTHAGAATGIEHSHWDWRKKRQAIEGLIYYRMVSLRQGCVTPGSLRW